MSRKRKPRVVAVCGSRSFPLTPSTGAEIVEMLQAYPQGTTFITRGSEGVDQFLLTAGPIIGYDVVAFAAQGGPSNFIRDVEMVRMADEVIVFLDPATLHDERTGTSHVLDKALDQHKKSVAWSAANNHLVFVGSSND